MGWRPKVCSTSWQTLLVFLIVFLTHAVSPSATSSDSHWTVPQMTNLLEFRGLDLHNYTRHLTEHRYQSIDCVDPVTHRISFPDSVAGCPGSTDRYYGRFPVAPALVAFPVFVCMDAAVRLTGPLVLHSRAAPSASPIVVHFFSREYDEAHGLVEVVIASCLIGLAAAFVFLTGLEFLPRHQAWMLVFLFAYCTAAWSTGSRALWQHCPEMLLFAITLYILTSLRRPEWTAIPLIISYFVRPTGGIALVVLGAYVWHAHGWRMFLRWSLLAALTVIPFVWLNFAVYGQPLQPYFTEQRFLPLSISSLPPFANALAGQLVSPSRGLLIFTPIFLFSIGGLVIALRHRWLGVLPAFLLGWITLHWFAISAFADWTAGYCFGPRYFSDLTPVFIFLLIPFLTRWGSVGPAVRAGFLAAAMGSFVIHFRGAVDWEVQRWNSPEVTPARAWDWRDPQFLRRAAPEKH